MIAHAIAQELERGRRDCVPLSPLYLASWFRCRCAAL